MTTKTLNALSQLKNYTTIVADSSDFDAIAQYKPQDATTNPSLILKASSQKKYSSLIDEAISFAKKLSTENILDTAIEKLFVNFGLEILKVIPGRVSIEVDAKYSFDVAKNVQIAKRLIKLFEENNIPKERILIKLASTWEGLEAGRLLEQEGIHCNMTLLFALPQAIVAAQNKATLISPFVGRILDWYKKNTNKDFSSKEDPGVISVTNIYNYFKKFDYKTQIMGASFRNIQEIIELTGCDLLTISPALLEELKNLFSIEIEKRLDVSKARLLPLKKQNLDEKTFRYLLNQDPMATEKLAEGIRSFEKDLNKLKDLIRAKL